MRIISVFALLLLLVQGRPADLPALDSGLTYRQEHDAAGPWAVSVLSIERARPEFRLTTALAQGTVRGLATVPALAKAMPPSLGTPVAAINGDWFTLEAGPYQGDISNLFIHRGELVSLPTWGDALWFDAKGQPQAGRVAAELTVTWPDGTRTKLGLNDPRPKEGAVLYTPTFGPSTHTPDGQELVLEAVPDRPWLPLRLGTPLVARVREVRATGNSALTPATMVLSLDPKLPKCPAVAVGDTLTLTATATPALDGVPMALGGSPVLLREGKVLVKANPNDPRHPRTLFGWNATHYFFIVIDGRRPGWSVGTTNAESAALALRLGCTDAINLDGGGSSTLWLNGQVMNRPSGLTLRPVANGLVLLKCPAPTP